MSKQMNKKLKTETQGVITKVETFQTLDTYTLDNGYTWGDSAGRHKVGDKVIVRPFIMGTVKVEKI